MSDPKEAGAQLRPRDELLILIDGLVSIAMKSGGGDGLQLLSALSEAAERLRSDSWLIAEREALERERDIALELHQSTLRLAGTDAVEAYEIGRGLRPSPFESGWLIEGWDSQSGQFKAQWWTLFEAYDGLGLWTKDSTIALRFARESDAQAYIVEAGWTEARPTEHAWSALSNQGKPSS